ncbi:MAG: hypothetical protein ABFR35_04420 [Thermodesulfobacteriota bacterium]
MKLFKILLISSMAFLVVSSVAVASDFGWTRDFNIQAQADPSGFRARLATRFNLGDVQVKAVLSNFDSPADAYMILRFGEMSGMPTSYVVEKYRHTKGKGWGALAKSLGIKPGSEEFHALKRGQDLHGGNNRGQILYSRYDRSNVSFVDNSKGKGKGKGKGKK